MAFGIKTKVDLSPLENSIKRNTVKAKRVLKTQVAYDMNRYVPMLSGDLRGSQALVRDGITWSGVYAKAQFYGTNGIVSFRNYTTAGTGKRWDLKAEGIHGKSWEELVRGCY